MVISEITDEYKENLIKTKSVDKENCHLIKDIIPKKNEGRKNDGIGFVKIDGNEYFLKFYDNLLNEFKTGYYLSKLNSIYPYFLNVHTILNCDYKPRSTDTKKLGHVLIVDKGTETVYDYLNRNTINYFNNKIPILNEKTKELDSDIENILKNDKMEENEKAKYIEKIIKNFYLNLSTKYAKFKFEFVNLFIHNYKVMLNLYFLLDVVIMNSYNHYLGDKKSDNYMVKTEKQIDKNKTHVEYTVKHEDKSETFKIDNTCIWDDDIREHCYVYPVDFGSCNVNVNYYDNIEGELQSIFLNIWIWSLMRQSIYSDTTHGNGNFLTFYKNVVFINFSKYYNNYRQIFDKYNIFSINIINPLDLFSLSFDEYEFNDTEKRAIKNDYRLEYRTKMNKYNNINLLDAIRIIDILFSGSTVIKKNQYNFVTGAYEKKYRRSINILSFYRINGMNEDTHWESENNEPHKKFIFTQEIKTDGDKKLKSRKLKSRKLKSQKLKSRKKKL